MMHTRPIFNTANVYSPFKLELDWKVAQWVKMRGPGSMAISELLSIPGVHVSLDTNVLKTK